MIRTVDELQRLAVVSFLYHRDREEVQRSIQGAGGGFVVGEDGTRYLVPIMPAVSSMDYRLHGTFLKKAVEQGLICKGVTPPEQGGNSWSWWRPKDYEQTTYFTEEQYKTAIEGFKRKHLGTEEAPPELSTSRRTGWGWVSLCFTPDRNLLWMLNHTDLYHSRTATNFAINIRLNTRKEEGDAWGQLIEQGGIRGILAAMGDSKVKAFSKKKDEHSVRAAFNESRYEELLRSDEISVLIERVQKDVDTLAGELRKKALSLAAKRLLIKDLETLQSRNALELLRTAGPLWLLEPNLIGKARKLMNLEEVDDE